MTLLRDGCCKHCLYGPTPLVDAATVADKTQEIARTDSWFVCHEAAARGVDAMCPGWLEAAGHTSNAGRMYSRIIAISGGAPLWKPSGPATDRDFQAAVNVGKRASGRSKR